MPPPTAPPRLHWDILCQVVDNWGDVGVCWRLACNLAARGQRVRLWMDDASALAWMAPQGCPGVQVLAWPPPEEPTPWETHVVIEAFGTDYATQFIAAYAMNTRAKGQNGSQVFENTPQRPLWINLEYLSAEGYVERSHRLPSPLLSGPLQGHTRWFFYPGFTERTGGLLREPDLLERQARFDAAAWLSGFGVVRQAGDQIISLFCYESPQLPQLLAELAQAAQRTHLLVAHGRTQNAVKNTLTPEFYSQIGQSPAKTLRRQLLKSEHHESLSIGQLHITYLPPLPQTDYDHLLWASDFNFVRGEDSLVRALWAGKPFIWHIYPQSDGAHAAKLEAFLDWLQAPPNWREAQRSWNGLGHTPWPGLKAIDAANPITQTRQKLLTQDDLVSQLLAFWLEKSSTLRPKTE